MYTVSLYTLVHIYTAQNQSPVFWYLRLVFCYSSPKHKSSSPKFQKFLAQVVIADCGELPLKDWPKVIRAGDLAVYSHNHWGGVGFKKTTHHGVFWKGRDTFTFGGKITKKLSVARCLCNFLASLGWFAALNTHCFYTIYIDLPSSQAEISVVGTFSYCLKNVW